MAAEAVLRAAYTAFNGRDVARALALMVPDVVWPNGMEGGVLRGHAAIQAYWIRQWTQIDPSVEPLRFTPTEDGRVDVEVHQVVRDLHGAVLKDAVVHHLYALDGDRIVSMEIRESRR